MAIKPSPRLVVLLLLFHAIAAAVAYLTAMPLTAKLAVLMLILLSLFYYLMRDALLLLPDSWREISLGQDNVSVVTRGGSTFAGQVTGKTVVSPHLVVLRLSLEGRRLPVSRTIFPDALGADEFRELRVWLRFSQ